MFVWTEILTTMTWPLTCGHKLTSGLSTTEFQINDQNTLWKHSLESAFNTHLCTPAKLLRCSPSTRRPCHPLLLLQPSCLLQDPNSHKILSLDTGKATKLKPVPILKLSVTVTAQIWGRILPVCLEKVTSLSSCSASASISSSVSQPSLSSSAFPGSSKSTSSKSSAKSSEGGEEEKLMKMLSDGYRGPSASTNLLRSWTPVRNKVNVIFNLIAVTKSTGHRWLKTCN